MNFISTRARKGTAVAFGSVAASAALVLAGMTSATAADVQLGPDDIDGYEVGGTPDTEGFNYDQWHIGSVENTDLTSEDSLTFNECSIEFLAPPENSGSSATDTQVLKGFEADQLTEEAGALEAVLNSLSLTQESGESTLQIPIFIFEDEESDEPTGFTTIRNDEAFSGAGTFNLEGQALTGSQGFGDFESPEALLEELADRREDGDRFVVLGTGITAEPGAIVNSLSFGDDTAFFGDGQCFDEGDDADEDDDDVDEDDDDADDSQAPTRPVAVETGR